MRPFLQNKMWPFFIKMWSIPWPKMALVRSVEWLFSTRSCHFGIADFQHSLRFVIENVQKLSQLGRGWANLVLISDLSSILSLIRLNYKVYNKNEYRYSIFALKPYQSVLVTFNSTFSLFCFNRFATGFCTFSCRPIAPLAKQRFCCSN